MGQQKILGDIERVGCRNPDAQRFPGAHGFDAVNVTFGHFPSATGSPAAAERSHALRQSNVEERSSEPVPLFLHGRRPAGGAAHGLNQEHNVVEAEGSRCEPNPPGSRRPVTIFLAASSTPLRTARRTSAELNRYSVGRSNCLTNEGSLRPLLPR